ncbi:N-6 DNA methylase [Streptomonospora nanhaiensis]|uniref:N-6 DNA methylase n=1 Tax=Streptomonospora nanhaiensis TaxID=1323731 RepID=A0ABY6YT04_9ACTN|nr:N-6 DNA methylase [Streptomonospora nanhaiensis]WAE75495.1 N-6 DNA methylase [Streptomonospora nanhaiensis]
MDSSDQSVSDEQQVTAADIARLAGVTRAAVSNWRRRHDDFPSPSSGTSSSPLFAVSQIRAWLDSQNKGVEESTEVQLWQALRAEYPAHMLRGLADVAEYLTEGHTEELGESTLRLVRSLVEETSPSHVTSALTTRFLNSHERSGTASASTTRLTRALTALTDRSATSVLDPACGTGSLLFAVGTPSASRTGQDIDPDAVRFAQARSALEHGETADIRVGDSLRSDQWPDHQVELVVCDPPPATTDWGREELLMDPRWELALPPRAESELAWLQHAYAHTAPGGQTAVVMSTSCAYRRTGRRIRADLVRRGLLTDVIALPAGLAAAHAQPVHLWLLRRPVSDRDSASAVRMWDLTSVPPDGPWQLPEEPDAEVPLIDLLGDAVDLNPARHVTPDVSDLPNAFADAHEKLRALADRLGDGLPPLAAGGPAVAESRVRIADLVDEGLVNVDGDSLRAVDDQLDTDFLNGFLRSASNTRRSTSTSGTFRTDARASYVPKLGVEEQRRYGAAFRAVADFERQARELSALAATAAELAREGLTSGMLRPDTPATPEDTSAPE